MCKLYEECQLQQINSYTKLIKKQNLNGKILRGITSLTPLNNIFDVIITKMRLCMVVLPFHA